MICRLAVVELLDENLNDSRRAVVTPGLTCPLNFSPFILKTKNDPSDGPFDDEQADLPAAATTQFTEVSGGTSSALNTAHNTKYDQFLSTTVGATSSNAPTAYGAGSFAKKAARQPPDPKFSENSLNAHERPPPLIPPAGGTRKPHFAAPVLMKSFDAAGARGRSKRSVARVVVASSRGSGTPAGSSPRLQTASPKRGSGTRAGASGGVSSPGIREVEFSHDVRRAFLGKFSTKPMPLDFVLSPSREEVKSKLASLGSMLGFVSQRRGSG